MHILKVNYSFVRNYIRVLFQENGKTYEQTAKFNSHIDRTPFGILSARSWDKSTIKVKEVEIENARRY